MQATTKTVSEQAENLKNDRDFLRAEADRCKTNFEKLAEQKRTLEVRSPSSCTPKDKLILKQNNYSVLQVRWLRSETLFRDHVPISTGKVRGAQDC